MQYQANSFNPLDVSYVRHVSAAAENPYYQTSAEPNSLASIVRSGVIIRDRETPISFPFEAEEVTGYYRRAG